LWTKRKSGHAAELNRPADRIAMAEKANFPIVARHLPTFLKRSHQSTQKGEIRVEGTTKPAKVEGALDVPQAHL